VLAMAVATTGEEMASQRSSGTCNQEC